MSTGCECNQEVNALNSCFDSVFLGIGGCRSLLWWNLPDDEPLQLNSHIANRSPESCNARDANSSLSSDAVSSSPIRSRTRPAATPSTSRHCRVLIDVTKHGDSRNVMAGRSDPTPREPLRGPAHRLQAFHSKEPSALRSTFCASLTYRPGSPTSNAPSPCSPAPPIPSTPTPTSSAPSPSKLTISSAAVAWASSNSPPPSPTLPMSPCPPLRSSVGLAWPCS